MGVENHEALLSQCFSNYIAPCLPGETLERVIELTQDRSRYAGEFAPLVLKNDLYSQTILKVDFLQTRIKAWLDEMPKGQENYRLVLERIFILLGKQASRNLIASIRLARMGLLLPRKKNDRFSPNPKEQLKQALDAEEFCASRNYASTDLAFIGGLQYDLLLTQLQKLKASREVLNAFPNLFSESIRSAHYAYEIGSRMGSFPNSEYAFSAGLSMGLGRVLSVIMYPKEKSPSFAGFWAEVEKKNAFKWEFADSEERRRFPLLPAEFASLVVSSMGMLSEIEPAIRYAYEPYFLKRVKPKLHALAWLTGVADRTALGRPLTPAQELGFKDLKIDRSILTEAARAVSGKGKEKERG